MKCGKILRRAAALALAALSLVPAELLMPARAALSTTQTKLVVWDWIDDMQTIGKNGGADYDPANESKNIPVGQVKYSRIMFYQNTGGDRYFFNATDRQQEGSGVGGYYSTFDEDKIYVKSSARVGNSSHKEWNSDMIAAEGGGSFLTKSGENTPYLQYAGTKEGFHSWRLWASTSGDNWSNHAVMLVDDYENLDVRRTNGFSSNAASHYGAHNDPIRADPWIIGKTFVGAAAANTRYSFDNSVIWHWDNDAGGYNETMDFDPDDTKFKAFNAGTKIGVEEFKIFLGKEYKVSTLAENFEVYKDQTQTLGKPVFYVPKDRTITVDKHATLVIDGVLLLDGTINVAEGGLLKLKDGAKVFPLTKYDVECGKIDSSGDIVIGTGAVLCGGANNGIRIGGGGVVNFGVLCGEYIQLEKNDLVDNRVEESNQGWIIAGKSLTGAARSRFVKAAILNEDTAKLTVDRSKDFATLSSTTSFFSKQLYSVYGDGAANVDTSGVGKSAIGSASNPTLTVYVSDKPGEKGTALFKNEMLDEVTLRVSGAEAVYTVRDKVYDTISNKLISAEIGRGTDVQTLFKDMWVGELKNAYVQLEPASAEGTCLAIKDGSTADGANVQLGARDPNQTDKAQWWRLVEDGKSGVNRTYILQSFKDASKSLDLPGNNSAPNGANVQIWTTAGDTGTDRRWLLVTDAMNRSYYRLRNAANTGVSLEADGTAAGVNVRVASNVESGQTVERQRWRFVNLFDEESYAASLKDAAAMELIPQNATGLRLQVSGMGSGVSTRVSTADSNNLAQRWELQQAGADLLEGVNTPYFRVINKASGMALTVNGDYKVDTAVTANTVEGGGGARYQYWYLVAATGSEQYYLKSRGDSSFVLASSGTGSGSAVRLAAYVKEEKSQLWEVTGAAAVVNQATETERTAASANDPYYGRVFELEAEDYTGRLLAGSSNASNVGAASNLTMGGKTTDGYDIHKWSFRYAGKDNTGSYYQIVPAERGEVEVAIGLVSGQKMEHRAELALVKSAPNDSTQLWRLTEQTSWRGTFYKITPKDDQDLELSVRSIISAKEDRYDPIISQRWQSWDEKGTHYTYNREYWKLIEAPLDGKTYSIVSVGYEDGFMIPYAAGASAQSSYVWVTKGVGSSSKAYWTFKWIKTEDAPCYQIISRYNGRALCWDGGIGYVTDTSVTDEVPNKELWYVQIDADGTVTIKPIEHSGTGIQVNKDDPHSGYYTMKATTLGSKPTNDQKWKLTEVDPNYDPLDGKVFTLRPKHDSNLTARLDVESYSVSNGTKLVLWEKREHESQRWKFECIGTASQEGETVRYYAIHSVYSPTRALDNGGGTGNGTRCTVWDYTASNLNQQWIVKDAGSGYYYIIPRKDATKCLECSGDDNGTGNGTAVQIWDNNGQEDAKWKLEETMAPVELGTYELEVVGAPGWTMDVYGDLNDAGADIQIFPAHERDYTRWTFVQMGTDGSGEPYYKIVNKGSGKVLDISDSVGVKEGAEVQQWSYDFMNDQLWYLDKAGSDDLGDFYYIKNKKDSYYKLCVLNAKYEKNQHINLTSGQEDNAKWRMNDKSEPVSLGIYEFGLTEPAYAHMRLELDGSAGAFDTDTSLHTVDDVLKKSFTCPGSGAYAKIYYRSGEADQAWQIVQRGKAMYNGEITPYYSIESVGSKLALDLAGTASDAAYNGAWVLQSSYDGYADQHWFLEIRGDNSVVFRNRVDTELVLAANGKSDGVWIKVENYDDKKSTTQRWYLHPIMLKNSSGQYYVPGNAAAAAIGIPYVEDKDVIYEPQVAGSYTLTPQHKSGIEGLRMDRANGDTGNGTKIQTYTNSGSNGQKWQLIPMGVDYHDGGGRLYYKLAAPTAVNQVAETSGHSVVTAAMNVQMYEYDGGYDQQWYLEEVGGADNTYYLIGRGTLSQIKKICIGVPSGAAQKEIQIQTATKTEKTYQQWQLDPVD